MERKEERWVKRETDERGKSKINAKKWGKKTPFPCVKLHTRCLSKHTDAPQPRKMTSCVRIYVHAIGRMCARVRTASKRKTKIREICFSSDACNVDP